MLIHIGDSTQNHDQSMYPVSFKAMNRIVSKPTKPIPPLDELDDLLSLISLFNYRDETD